MERGGGALRCNLSCWPLFSRSRTLLDSRLRRRSSLRGTSAEFFLVDRFRSFISSKGIRNSIMPKALGKSHSSLRVFNSLGPQESKLDQDGITKNLFLIDCGTGQECVTGGIVALGKFDALHIGHRELAIQASKAGIPFLLSFVGMAEVLGWESRAPIVAKCDRKRVLSSWAPHCGNVVPLEYQVEFSIVRHLTPRQFVEKLSNELGVGGVVAGENYRFGYRASGDASELVRLCREYDLAAYIVSPVMDKSRPSCNGSAGGTDRGQVSSSRVRHALAMGDMGYVAELLGRKHRLVVEIDGRCLCVDGRISAPVSCVLNQMPKYGTYDRCTLVADGASLGSCRVAVNAETVDIEINDFVLEDGFVGIEFR